MSILIVTALAVMLSGQNPLRQPLTTAEDGASASNPRKMTRGIEYPALALERGVSGSATIRCQLDLDALLTACTVVAETPPSMGFGRELIQASRSQQIEKDDPLIGKDIFFSANFSLQ